jgi:hypothetical protein
LALLRLLATLLLPPVLFLLPFSVDIMRQCGIVHLGLLKFLLNRSKFVFLPFQYENEGIYLVYYTLHQLKSRTSVQYELTSLRWGTPLHVLEDEEASGVSEEEEELAPTSRLSHPSRRREKERCGGG